MCSFGSTHTHTRREFFSLSPPRLLFFTLTLAYSLSLSPSWQSYFCSLSLHLAQSHTHTLTRRHSKEQKQLITHAPCRAHSLLIVFAQLRNIPLSSTHTHSSNTVIHCEKEFSFLHICARTPNPTNTQTFAHTNTHTYTHTRAHTTVHSEIWWVWFSHNGAMSGIGWWEGGRR